MPADPGGDGPEESGWCFAVGCVRDDEAVQDLLGKRREEAGGIQQAGGSPGGSGEAAQRGGGYRRAGRPDAGSGQGGGGIHLPGGSDGPCRRRASGDRHPASLCGRDYWSDEGQHPQSDRLCRGVLAGIPHHSGYHRCGKAGGQGRYALRPAGGGQAHPCAGLLYLTGGDRGRGVLCEGKRRGQLFSGGHRPDRAVRSGEREQGRQGRVGCCCGYGEQRRGRAAACRRGRGAGNGTGFRFHAPAAAEAGLFPRCPAGGSDGGAGHCGAAIPRFQNFIQASSRLTPWSACRFRRTSPARSRCGYSWQYRPSGSWRENPPQS